jgi:hypothetical protein
MKYLSVLNKKIILLVVLLLFLLRFPKGFWFITRELTVRSRKNATSYEIKKKSNRMIC